MQIVTVHDAAVPFADIIARTPPELTADPPKGNETAPLPELAAPRPALSAPLQTYTDP